MKQVNSSQNNSVISKLVVSCMSRMGGSLFGNFAGHKSKKSSRIFCTYIGYSLSFSLNLFAS